GGEQGELVAVAQPVRAPRVGTGDDRQRRVQRARDPRLVRGEAIAGVGDRRALVELEGVQRRGGEAGEPGAEADADLHTARAYAAPRRISTSAQRVLADVVHEGRAVEVRALVDERLLARRVVEQRARHADELLRVVDLAGRVVVARVGHRDLLEESGGGVAIVLQVDADER